MRFQHILGVMHLSSRTVTAWYDSLSASCANVPSKAYVESLMRMAGLLHDVGHGPFGHFFDDQYLAQYGITHEDIGSHIIENVLGEQLRKVRRNPNGQLQPLEEIEPRQIAWLIRRPLPGSDEGQPDWLCKLRALFSGIYTVDNMDFVLRDAYMSGYNTKAVDISRLIHYSFFTKDGLTIHARGLPSLINFIETRANLFRTIYFHRTVRALDLSLEDCFAETMSRLFTGNPLDNLDGYLGLTESSFMVDVLRWPNSDDPETKKLGERWRRILSHEESWKMACERTMNFHGTSERTSIFSEPDLVERRVRERLPDEIKDLPLRIDVAKHYHRPSARLPTGGQNFLLDPATEATQQLNDDELFRNLPTSFLICRIYSQTHDHDRELSEALTAAIGGEADTKTNM